MHTELGRSSEGSLPPMRYCGGGGSCLFDLGAIQFEIKPVTGVEVDVLTPDDLPEHFRARVLGEALPV